MVDYAERMKNLGEIVEGAQRDPDANAMIRRLVVGILTFLGLNAEQADSFTAVWLEPAIRFSDNIVLTEQTMHEALKQRGAFRFLSEAMSLRAEAWYKKLGCYVEAGGDVLDLGGGSGELACMMFNGLNCIKASTVTIADAIDWRKVDLPFLPVQNNKVAADDGSFDTVMAVTVFHHSDDPEALVQEAFRLAKRRVVFIESVTQDLLLYKVGCWIDWMYNGVIHLNEDPIKRINVPFRFMSAPCWEQLVWRLTGLEPLVSQNLGFFQHLNPENHWLFVYDKK